MSIALRSCALLLAVATAASTADPESDELLKQTRAKVLDNARRMPRYTCVETVSRTQYQPPDSPSTCQTLVAMRRLMPTRGALMLRDRLRLDVAVVEGGEMFSWAGAGKFETHEVDKLVGGGASGSGEFGSFLAAVFGGTPDAIRYAGLSNSLGLFEYNVPVARSNYRYQTAKGGRTIGYKGTFSVDPADADVEQLVVESDQFAAADGVCLIRHVMDYNRVKIGKGDFLLPEVSTMDALYHSGAESLNETRYSDCREYVGESTIRFDDPDAAGGADAAKAALPPLPPKTRLLIGLSKPINAEVAAAGDAVEGVVLPNAVARVRGRILRLQEEMVPKPRWIVEIRFDTIERKGVEQPISLKPVGSGVFIFAQPGNLVLDQTFHSEWETK